MITAVSDIDATVDAMLSGALSEDELLELFTALDEQNFSGADLAAAARQLQSYAVRLELPGDPMDTCGTGGSGLKRINTSTVAAFVAAAAGARIAKHGNRASSGRCGSFDLLEGLGARIDLAPEQARAAYDDCGIVFLFAPLYHPAMRAVGAARKRYGKPTIFNLLGPLCNPAGVRCQLLGTSNLRNAGRLADALHILGNTRSLVVCGNDTLDEITVCGATTILDAGSGAERVFHPTDIGLHEHAPEAVEGGDVATNVIIARHILEGHGTAAQRDLILVNAAHALLLTPLVSNITEALELAATTLDLGAAGALLDRYVHFTHSLS